MKLPFSSSADVMIIFLWLDKEIILEIASLVVISIYSSSLGTFFSFGIKGSSICQTIKISLLSKPYHLAKL